MSVFSSVLFDPASFDESYVCENAQETSIDTEKKNVISKIRRAKNIHGAVDTIDRLHAVSVMSPKR